MNTLSTAARTPAPLSAFSPVLTMR